MDITQGVLHHLFEYRDGDLYWREKKYCRRTDIPAGFVRPDGYREIRIHGKSCLTARMIFLYHHGYLPECVDHISRDITDNRIENLREATKAQNSQNQKRRNSNNSGVKGVFWDKDRGKWRSEITHDRTRTFVGFFDDIEDAKVAYDAAVNGLHKEFGTPNDP